jgi:hypothetical protein
MVPTLGNAISTICEFLTLITLSGADSELAVRHHFLATDTLQISLVLILSSLEDGQLIQELEGMLHPLILISEQNFVAQQDIDYFIVLNTEKMSWDKGIYYILI